MCLNTGTPKNINFSFVTNGKLMALGVPILKHFRVSAVELAGIHFQGKQLFYCHLVFLLNGVTS